MIDRLVSVLRALDPNVGPVEIAEVLWLADRIGSAPAVVTVPRQRSGDEPHPQPVRGQDRPSPVDGGTDVPDPGPAPQPDPASGNGSDGRRGQPGPTVPRPPSTRLTLPDEATRGVPVRSPTVAALAAAGEIARALRPLCRRRPARTARLFDEEATAAQAAEADIWSPVLRPEDEHWMDAVLLVDDSESMIIWQQTAVELGDLLARQAAFRDVRTLRFNSDLTGDRSVRIYTGAGGPDGTRHRPGELIDPSGRRLILVLTDGVGDGWRDRPLRAELERWAVAGPVVLLQPLPQRLWDGSGLSVTPTTTVAAEAGAPNATLAVRPAPQAPGGLPPGLPVPVVELDPRWLATWSRMMMATTVDPMPCPMMFTRSAPPTEEPATTGSVDKLTVFLANASTNAIYLARYLSAAPLNLPVIRLIQSTMLPASHLTDLAELFLSDLLCTIDTYGTNELGDGFRFDFQPGYRTRLLDGLSRADAIRVLSEASAFVSARLGSPIDFRALLTPGAETPQLSQHFAEVAYEVLRSLGGRYAEAAKELRRGGERQPTNPDNQRGDDVERQSDVAANNDRQLSGASAPSSGAAAANVVGSRHSSGDSSLSATSSAMSSSRRTPALPAIWGGIPIRNTLFTGREEHLLSLRDLLMRDEQVALVSGALYGMGGVGKTQLAVEYAHRYSGDYDLVWWIPSEDPALIRKSLSDLAERLNLAAGEDRSRGIEAVRESLRVGIPYNRWLLIFDNAEQPSALAAFLPGQATTGHVIVTSRNHAWAEIANPVEVDVFKREESIELLVKRAPEMTGGDASKLADRLGDLPLALEQAASWMAETGMTVTDYLRLFDSHLTSLLNESAPSSYPKTVVATWRTAFTDLSTKQPAAARLLELLVFFGSEPVPVDVLRRGVGSNVPAELRETLQDDIQLRRAIRALRRYALVKVDPGGARLHVHRLFQAVLRDDVDEDRRVEMVRTVQAILARAHPGLPDKPANWPLLADMAPHVLPTGLVEGETPESRQVALDQIRYHYVVGDYETARVLGRVVVDTWREMPALGPDHERTLIACRHLADALRALGQTREARALDEDTLDRMTRQLGKRHEHTLITSNSVGADLRIAGDFAAARVLDEGNVRAHIDVFGEDDENTFNAMNNLGVDLKLLGKFAEAREIDERVLELRRENLGVDHPMTYYSQTNVVRDLYGLAYYADALRLQQEILPLYRDRLGENHNDVLLASRNIATALRKLGRHADAVVRAEENYRAYLKRFGPSHEHTLAAMTSLANALREGQVSDRERARDMAEQALAGYRRTFGLDHPFTLACTVNLAIIRRTLNDIDIAHTLDEQTLAKLRATLGDDHPYTLCCANNMTNNLARLDEHQAARELSEKTLTRSRTVRGTDHPYTLAVATNVALDMRATGDTNAGDALLAQTIELLQRRLGDTHPETLEAIAGHRLECDIEPPPT